MSELRYRDIKVSSFDLRPRQVIDPLKISSDNARTCAESPISDDIQDGIDAGVHFPHQRCTQKANMSSALEVQHKATMFVRLCIQCSSLALLYYDYAITWPREVQHIWMRKFSFGTALYFTCRYGMVSNVIYALALTEKLPMMRDCACVGNSEIILLCDQGYRLAAIVACIGRIAIVLVWGLRTYAISNRNICVLTIFGLFGSSVIGLAILHVPYAACHGYRGNPPGTQETMDVGFSFKLFLAIQSSVSVARVLFAGLLYFASVTVLTICTVVLQHAAPVACHGRTTPFSVALIQSLQEGFFIQRLLNAHTLPLSGLMTARFLLHLRVWSHRRCTNSFVETPSLGLFKNIEADAQPGYSARASFIMHSIVDEFGEDPVAQAHRQAVSTGGVEDIELYDDETYDGLPNLKHARHLLEVLARCLDQLNTRFCHLQPLRTLGKLLGMHILQFLASFAALSTLANAHPGGEELMERDEFRARSLQARSCSSQIARFVDMRRALREPRPLRRGSGGQDRDNDDDNHSGGRYTDIQNFTCVTAPEVTEGPYYVGNEYVRNDLRENQQGVTLILDIGVIDTTTCQPFQNAFVDLWAANSTGFYGGYQGGNIHQDTWLRGGEFTNTRGMVEITTIFPGFYVNRTAHVHIMVHKGSEARPNGTIISSSGTTTHIGQFFFDESWNDQVYATHPYNTNTQGRTLNSQDWFIGSAEGQGFVHMQYLGNSLDDGLLGYITVAVDGSKNYTVQGKNEL
ncbi:unnamed protein product [Cyclocybe aegerita]|uniref:Intradiol ring-cleavage dioxygenases domain-containing protein n=1 Tax=Cyclocybe aegerita TaxID=1973307 RepID=A0A8S0XYE6_CYCAE|nr:unnamed protein product [Cyclocybe aegerita]